MRKCILFTGIFSLMIGCSSVDTMEEENTAETNEITSGPQELSEDEEVEEKVDSSSERPEDSFTLEELVIPTIPIESPYDEDGNIKHTHTEQEIVEEYMDDDGRIYFSLDDDPIRNITKGEDQTIIQVTNYSDVFIDMVENEAFQLTDEQKENAYQLVLDNPPIGFEQPDLSEYRSWEEATNLERGLMQMTVLVAPTIYNLLYLIEEDLYVHEFFPALLGEMERVASPAVQIPAPQTQNDIALFETMLMVQELWRQLGQFEDPANNKEEFIALHNTVREETNHMIARIHATLSEERY